MTFGITAAGVAIAGGVAAIAGAGISAYSAYEQGQAANQAAQYQAQVAKNNATIASYNANAATATGNTQVQAEEEQAAQHQGMIRAVMGASGLDLNSGSSLRDQQGVAEVDELNKQTIVSNAARSAWNYTNQGADFSATSNLETMQGEQAAEAGMLGSFSSMLSGASTVSSNWYKPGGGGYQATSS
jgi:hypothetical protein